MLSNELKSTQYRKIVIALSIIIPIAVAALFGIKIPGIDLSFLPPFYAGINGVTAILLILALVFIKNGKRRNHEITIKVCMALSVVFLLSYIAYHMTSDPTEYTGKHKIIYYFILISHILLSVAVIPIVLFAYLFAWEGDFVKHKKWTRFAFPIWLYVAITGVIVYFMIAPFYPA
jgi:putative membrane protein